MSKIKVVSAIESWLLPGKRPKQTFRAQYENSPVDPAATFDLPHERKRHNLIPDCLDGGYFAIENGDVRCGYCGYTLYCTTIMDQCEICENPTVAVGQGKICARCWIDCMMNLDKRERFDFFSFPGDKRWKVKWEADFKVQVKKAKKKIARKLKSPEPDEPEFGLEEIPWHTISSHGIGSGVCLGGSGGSYHE